MLVLLLGEESGQGDDIGVDLLLPDWGWVVAVHDGDGGDLESIGSRRRKMIKTAFRELVGRELCAERQE